MWTATVVSTEIADRGNADEFAKVATFSAILPSADHLSGIFSR
jgi:hypothetical protein